MKTIAGPFLSKIFSRLAAYYVIAAVLVITNLNMADIKAARANYLQDTAAYPVLYVTRRASFDERMFRLAKKYYQAFIYNIPLYAKSEFLDESVALSRSYTMLAICDHYLGHTDEAIGSFKKALALEPRDFWVNYNVGLAYYREGDYAAAVGYFKNSFVLKLLDLDRNMDLDYFQYWPPRLINQYKTSSLLVLHDTIVKSYELSILSYEKMKNPEMVKTLAAGALQSGFVQESNFFKYYLGLSSQKPDIDMTSYDFMINPSVSFVPIGKEKFLAKKYADSFNKTP